LHAEAGWEVDKGKRHSKQQLTVVWYGSCYFAKNAQYLVSFAIRCCDSYPSQVEPL
jgi:hypothetical protein